MASPGLYFYLKQWYIYNIGCCPWHMAADSIGNSQSLIQESAHFSRNSRGCSVFCSNKSIQTCRCQTIGFINPSGRLIPCNHNLYNSMSHEQIPRRIYDIRFEQYTWQNAFTQATLSSNLHLRARGAWRRGLEIAHASEDQDLVSPACLNLPCTTLKLRRKVVVCNLDSVFLTQYLLELYFWRGCSINRTSGEWSQLSEIHLPCMRDMPSEVDWHSECTQSLTSLRIAAPLVSCSERFEGLVFTGWHGKI